GIEAYGAGIIDIPLSSPVSFLRPQAPGFIFPGVYVKTVVMEGPMLTIPAPSSTSLCADLTRRNFLRLGALTLRGLTLGDVLRLRAKAPARGEPRQKSVIMIHLSGGPSHLDMYDMKPAAPSEYRGEFRPIKTNVPGLEICELMPRQAQIAQKFALLR